MALTRNRGLGRTMRKPRNLIIIAIIVVVLIIAGSVGAILWSNYQTAHPGSSSANGQSGSNGTSSGSAALTPQQVARNTADDAEKLASNGNVQGGAQALNNAIKNTTDTSQLFIYYSQLAAMLLNANQLPDALTAAKQAYTLNQTSDSGALVGEIAALMGDKPTAIQYYTNAINHIDPNDMYAQSDKQYYQSVISNLQGGK